MPSLYEDLQSTGAEMDNHESDLYVKATPETRLLVEVSGLTFTEFRSEADGAAWLDVPFAYLPWWEHRAGAGALGRA